MRPAPPRRARQAGAAGGREAAAVPARPVPSWAEPEVTEIIEFGQDEAGEPEVLDIVEEVDAAGNAEVEADEVSWARRPPPSTGHDARTRRRGRDGSRQLSCLPGRRRTY